MQELVPKQRSYVPVAIKEGRRRGWLSVIFQGPMMSSQADSSFLANQMRGDCWYRIQLPASPCPQKLKDMGFCELNLGRVSESWLCLDG